MLIDYEDISNEPNNFFSTIGLNMASKIPSVAASVDMLKTIIRSSMVFFCDPCFVHEVYHEIMCLNENKAAGIENIPIQFIKISSECISAVLSNIFNKCIQDRVFPSKLKVAKITPIHKGGCTFKTTNYCPISVLSPFYKIFKIIIYKNSTNISQDTIF